MLVLRLAPCRDMERDVCPGADFLPNPNRALESNLQCEGHAKAELKHQEMLGFIGAL